MRARRCAAATVRAMAVVGLDHVQVAAPPGCEADARRFYGDLLGLAELERPAALAARGGAWFALGSWQQVHVGVEGAVGELRPHLELRALVAGPDGAACELRE